MKYNTNLLKIKENSLSEFNKYLSSINKITLLTYGESDLPVEKYIKSQMIDSILKNNDKYSPSQGLLSTRNIICNLINNRYKIHYTEENILITFGSTEALYLSLSSILNPKDEVLIPLPNYPLYQEISSYLQAKITYINYLDDYHIDLDDLKNKININTKALILNYPNNPTGIYLTSDEFFQIKQLILKYNVILILDNVYEDIVFSKQANYVLTELENNLVIVNSLSKSKQLTGWRLGYLISNKKIISLSKKLHEMISICMPNFLMESMNYALISPCNISYYQNNSEYVYNYLKKLKLKVIRPDGGFYISFNIEEFNMDSITFCKYLANDFKLGLLPGVFFNFENHIRISIAVSYQKLKIGMKKLKKAISKLKRRQKSS